LKGETKKVARLTIRRGQLAPPQHQLAGGVGGEPSKDSLFALEENAVARVGVGVVVAVAVAAVAAAAAAAAAMSGGVRTGSVTKATGARLVVAVPPRSGSNQTVV